uniref:DUF2754 family protein n=1 Tax=Shigella flexneri TaxID=623 RepID=UPI002096774E
MADFTLSKSLFSGKYRNASSTPGNIAYAFAIGLIFILNGVVGVLGFEAKGWQTYAVGLVTWVISFWLA